MLRLDEVSENGGQGIIAPGLRRLRTQRTVLSVCFARRRRMLRNNLRAALRDDQIDHLLSAVDTRGDLRAETLEPDVFLRMADRWDETTLL